MKIYVLADMEGISGIRKIEEVKTDSPSEYEYGRQLMMQDINAAVTGCFDGGASEVVVADTHGGGGQVRIGEMDPRAIYETPNCGLIMPSLDDSFDGVILLGHHAKAGTLDGFLDHTMSSLAWFEYRINDTVVGEIGIEAAWAGHYGVPVIMVSGDQATAEEALQLLGSVETAVVKWGVGRNRAKCLPLDKAHAMVTACAERAVGSAAEYEPYKPDVPGWAQLTFYRSDMADAFRDRPEIERVDARTIRRRFDKLLDVRIR
jgi:D-amino peptidase